MLDDGIGISVRYCTVIFDHLPMQQFTNVGA